MSQTIDQIFLSHAAKNGEQIALTEAPGPARLGLSPVPDLSYSAAAAYIRHMATKFRQCGFNEGDVIVVQLPNIAEAPLLLLSIINAGLVPALMPSHWRGAELGEALIHINPRAIIAHSSDTSYDPFPAIFEIAAEHMGLRYIYGLGPDLPDGVTPLSDLTTLISEDIQTPAKEDKAMLRRSGEQLAFIAWTRDENCRTAPVAYTHLQLMANAHLLISAAGLTDRLSLLTAYGPTNPVGLIGAFIPWMMEGGSIHLISSLKQALVSQPYNDHAVNLALLPEQLAPRLSELELGDGLLGDAPHLFLVASTPHSPPPPYQLGSGAGAVTSVVNLNALCLIPRQTNDYNDEGLLFLGPQPGPDGDIVNPPFIETRIQGATQKAGSQDDVLRGRLEVNGTAIGFTNWQPDMTTSRHFNFNNHWEKTGLEATIINQSLNRLRLEAPESTVYYGSTPFSSDELDRLYQTYPGFIDAAAFTIKDATLGERLLAAIIPTPGEALSYEDFKNHLLTQNISPAKIPEKLVTVEEIPRNEDGYVTRSAILSHP